MLGLPWLLLTALLTLAAGVVAFVRHRRKPIKPKTQVLMRERIPWPDWALVTVGIASLLLAGWVAARQTTILENQAQIAELQADLMRTQYMPMFQLKLIALDDPYAETILRQQLTVTNTGGQVRDFKISPMAFLEIQGPYDANGRTLPSTLTRIPFLDYYGPAS